VVIGRLWLAQHRLVERVGSYDEAFLLINLVWALTIVVLPFSTQVIAGFGTDGLSVGLYVGTIAASSTATTLLTVLVRRRPALRREGVTATDVDATRVVVSTALLVLALLLGVAFRAVNFLRAAVAPPDRAAHATAGPRPLAGVSWATLGG
jgi:uncharacterized membrane protein